MRRLSNLAMIPSVRAVRQGPAAGRWAPLLAVLLLSGMVVSAAPAAEGWPPEAFATKIKAEPKTDMDKEIKQLIAGYESRIARLKPDDPLVKANLPKLRDNLAVLYQEYNRNHNRYRSDHLPPASCIQRLKGDMTFNLETCLEKGVDPELQARGRWHGKAYWVERTDIMGQYDIICPRSYDPKKPAPVVFSYQDDPDMNQMRTKTDCFLIRCIQRGYPRGLVAVENKTRSILKDAARDFNIDPFRIYATGFSYGGRTDLIMAWRHPHWFAAIAPVCNDLRDQQTPYVRQLRNVPTLLLHGTGDSFLATGKVVHKHMQDAGCPVQWMTYPGGHAPTLPFRQDVTVLTKFFDKHVMNPYPKMVNHIVEHPRYSRAFWVDAKLTKNAGGMEAIFTVTVKGENRIEIDANEQIAELDLYLNDKLVDMSRPVTVVAVGSGSTQPSEKTLYQGKAPAKLTVKLRDAPDYHRGGGDSLWEDLVRIRKEAGR